MKILLLINPFSLLEDQDTEESNMETENTSKMELENNLVTDSQEIYIK